MSDGALWTLRAAWALAGHWRSVYLGIPHSFPANDPREHYVGGTQLCRNAYVPVLVREI